MKFDADHAYFKKFSLKKIFLLENTSTDTNYRYEIYVQFGSSTDIYYMEFFDEGGKNHCLHVSGKQNYAYYNSESPKITRLRFAHKLSHF